MFLAETNLADLYRGVRDSQLIGMSSYTKEVLYALERMIHFVRALMFGINLNLHSYFLIVFPWLNFLWMMFLYVRH